MRIISVSGNKVCVYTSYNTEDVRTARQKSRNAISISKNDVLPISYTNDSIHGVCLPTVKYRTREYYEVNVTILMLLNLFCLLVLW